tara:strand:- start:1287 stop:2117 length:831 start_codon:yes stop_codon:yes gene_type:complete
MSSFYEQFKEKMDDQDFKQKINVGLTLIFEIYRVLMGSFLIAFVPQKCGDSICSLNDNINSEDSVIVFGNTCNMLTFLSFLLLYYFEVKRENKLITYLHVNTELPRDNDAVGETLQNLSPIKAKNIWDLDYYYKYSGYFSLSCFLLNAGISSVIIIQNIYDDKTITVLFTNVLFMALKLNDIYTILNTEKNIFLSAFLTRKIQFNDVDPDKLITMNDNNIYTNSDCVNLEINIDDMDEVVNQDIENNIESITEETHKELHPEPQENPESIDNRVQK